MLTCTLGRSATGAPEKATAWSSKQLSYVHTNEQAVIKQPHEVLKRTFCLPYCLVQVISLVPRPSRLPANNKLRIMFVGGWEGLGTRLRVIIDDESNKPCLTRLH